MRKYSKLLSAVLMFFSMWVVMESIASPTTDELFPEKWVIATPTRYSVVAGYFVSKKDCNKWIKNRLIALSDPKFYERIPGKIWEYRGQDIAQTQKAICVETTSYPKL